MKILRYTLLVIAVLMLVATAGFIAWTRLNLAKPADDALAALRSDDRVIVESGRYITFSPTGDEKPVGLVVYPGANCDPRGYAAVLRRIAEQGYFVVMVPMPLNLAIFDIDRIDDVRDAFPDIGRWVLAGHSLGGAMASIYAYEHPDALAGLLLWDSHPPESNPLLDVQYPVWHIHRATPDGTPGAAIEAHRSLFPADSVWVPVPGGNHMNFGSFIGGGYQEEWAATISREAEHDIIVTGTLNALQAMGGRTAPEARPAGSGAGGNEAPADATEANRDVFGPDEPLQDPI